MSYTTLLCECINSLYPINSTIVLCGDFNFPRINWFNSNTVLTNVNSCSGIIINFFYKLSNPSISIPINFSINTEKISIIKPEMADVNSSWPAFSLAGSP